MATFLSCELSSLIKFVPAGIGYENLKPHNQKCRLQPIQLFEIAHLQTIKVF